MQLIRGFDEVEALDRGFQNSVLLDFYWVQYYEE